MNNDRRKRLGQARELLEQAQEIIDEVKDEESEAYENMPEGLQCSERGETMETNVSTLEDVSDYVSSALDNLDCIE